MRNLLALAALGLLVFLGLGWYLGWYQVQSKTSGDGHRQIEIDLNTNKIKADLKKGETKVHDWFTDDANPQSSNNKPSTPGANTPTTPGSTTSYQPAENVFVFPGSSPAPTSGSTLPTPR